MPTKTMEKTTKYLRRKKAERYAEIVSDYRDLTGQLRIDEYDDVKVSPLGQIEGASERPQRGMIIDDCDFCARIDTRKSDRNPRQIRGRVLYGGYFRSQWGHFLMNSTSRLWPLFTDAVHNVDQILFFSDNDKNLVPGGNYKEFLELAGIADKVVIVREDVEIEHLIVPEIAFEQMRHFSSEAMAVFEAVRRAALTEPEKAEKILLTRSSLPTASKDEINIEKIDDLFRRNGYRIVSPEKLPLGQLIRMLNSAQAIASLSGSTAHNLVFASPNVELIIVERTPINNIFQIAITLMAGHDLVLIDAFRLPRIAPSTGRLFLYGATDPLERFITDRGWTDHTFDSSDSARRRELRSFLTRHLRQSGHATGIEGWEIDGMKATAEAYLESYEYYRPWLDRRHPVLLSDYFSPRCLLRHLLHK